jgi:hypothetical protein
MVVHRGMATSVKRILHDCLLAALALRRGRSASQPGGFLRSDVSHQTTYWGDCTMPFKVMLRSSCDRGIAGGAEDQANSDSKSAARNCVVAK